MRARTIKKNFWLNEDENKILRAKCQRANITEADFFRALIMDCQIKEKPDKDFYDAIKTIRGIAINLNQIARKANSLNLIDAPLYKKMADKVCDFMIDIKAKYLIDRKKT